MVPPEPPLFEDHTHFEMVSIVMENQQDYHVESVAVGRGEVYCKTKTDYKSVYAPAATPQ